MVNYFIKYVPHLLAEINAPLKISTKKYVEFRWEEEQKQVF